MALFNKLFNLIVTSFISMSINDAAQQIEGKNKNLSASTVRSYCNTKDTGKIPSSNSFDLIGTVLDIADSNIKSRHTDPAIFYHNAGKLLQNNFVSEEVINMLLDKKQPILNNIERLLTYSLTYLQAVQPINEYFDRSLLTQTPFFIGRNQTIETVTNEILINRKSVYLSGIGGIGKSEIVKAVVSNILNSTADTQFDSILWINFNNNDTSSLKYDIVTNYQKRKDIADVNNAFNDAIKNLRKLQNRLLIVIDNIEVISDELNTLICSLPKAIFLLAGRVEYESLSNNIKKITIGNLSSDDCFELFCHYFYKKSINPSDISETDNDAITKIIALADYHTVTVELLAKLASQQDRNLPLFLSTLIKYGFHFKFFNPDGTTEDEGIVKSHHELMRDQERHLIEQLKILFKIFGLNSEEEKLLIQISVIPNLPFTYSMAKKWFSLLHRSALLSLSEKGWLLKSMNCNAVNTYWIHSIIASAVRAQYTIMLHELCQPFIAELTNDLIESLPKNDKAKKNLIQFCWAINDIFSNKFSTITDCNFLYVLAKIYEEIGFYNRALSLYELVIEISESTDNGFYGRNLVQIINIYASLKLQIGDYDNAIAYYEMLLKSWLDKNTLKTASSDAWAVYGVLKSNFGHALLLKLRTIKTREEYTQVRLKAIQNINKGYKILSQNNDPYNTSVALLYKAYLYLWDYDYSHAEKYYLQALKSTASLPDTKLNQTLIITLKKELGTLFAAAYDSGKENQISLTYEQAKAILNEALSACKRYYSAENIRTLDIYNTIYSIDLIFGNNYELLAKKFSKLLLIYKNIYESDTLNGEALVENITNIYNNIGACYHNIGFNLLNKGNRTDAYEQLNKALDMYKSALEIDQEINGDTAMSLCPNYTNIGIIYTMISEISDKEQNLNFALQFFDKAQKIYLLQKNYHEVAYTLYHIADCYLALNKNDEVLGIAKSIEEIYNGNTAECTETIQIEIYWLYARCFKNMGEISKAKQYGEKIKLMYTQSGLKPQTKEVREITSFIKGCI